MVKTRIKKPKKVANTLKRAFAKMKYQQTKLDTERVMIDADTELELEGCNVYTDLVTGKSQLEDCHIKVIKKNRNPQQASSHTVSIE